MPQLCCARTHSYFPVETDHPPSAIPEDCRWGATNRLFFQRTFYPPLLFKRPDSMTLVLLFLTAGYRDSEFQFSPFIIHLKWHYCQYLFAFCGGHMGDLFARKEQRAGPFRVIRLGGVGGLPCGDGGADEVGLAAARDHARAFERAMSGAQGFDFISEQFQTRLDGLE